MQRCCLLVAALWATVAPTSAFITGFSILKTAASSDCRRIIRTLDYAPVLYGLRDRAKRTCLMLSMADVSVPQEAASAAKTALTQPAPAVSASSTIVSTTGGDVASSAAAAASTAAPDASIAPSDIISQVVRPPNSTFTT